MAGLNRDPMDVAGRRFDVGVIGGGIYGACMALEAARRGLTCVLLERPDSCFNAP